MFDNYKSTCDRETPGVRHERAGRIVEDQSQGIDGIENPVCKGSITNRCYSSSRRHGVICCHSERWRYNCAIDDQLYLVGQDGAASRIQLDIDRGTGRNINRIYGRALGLNCVGEEHGGNWMLAGLQFYQGVFGI